MKDMKLICNRIQESKMPGPFARLLSEFVEETPEPPVEKTSEPMSDAVPIALPVSSLYEYL